MIIKHLRLKNWRNFLEVDVELQQRQFIVGANASGKSNLLDALRFLRDVAAEKGGGLQKAIEDRGGVSKLRCLSARSDPVIEIEIRLSNSAKEEPVWKYSIGIVLDQRRKHDPILDSERIEKWENNEWKPIRKRPDKHDRGDPARLKQTHLEQVNENKDFRDIVDFLAQISYFHVVPQLMRHADYLQGRVLEHDPFGQQLLLTIAKTREKTRKPRLNKINRALKMAMPNLESLELKHDEASGRPHLSARYKHWRAHGAIQDETQFSDGTLRLIGLLWSLLDGDSLLLLEEPELSLHAGIVITLAALIWRVQRESKRGRQVLVSTHSETLLSDGGIDGKEILLLIPKKDGNTDVRVAHDIKDIAAALKAGLAPGDVVIRRTEPKDARQLQFFPQ